MGMHVIQINLYLAKNEIVDLNKKKNIWPKKNRIISWRIYWTEKQTAYELWAMTTPANATFMRSVKIQQKWENMKQNKNEPKKICKQQMHLFRNINTEKLKKSLQWAMSMLRIKIDTNECLA